MKITSAQIKLALRSTFPAPGWRVFYEVGNDTGSRVTRHADAVAMGIWPSNGHMIHGMEIKVSRGDFLAEMRDPTKAQAVFQFCNRWSLVTPAGLVKADELPEPWGLMTFDGKSVRVIKPAPPLSPVPLTPGFVAAMLRRSGEADEALIEAAVERAVAKATDDRRKAVEEAVTRERERRVSSNHDSASKLAAYERVFGSMRAIEIEGMAPLLKTLKVMGTDRGWSAAMLPGTTPRR